MEEIIITEAVMDVPDGNEEHGDRSSKTSPVSHNSRFNSSTSDITLESTTVSDDSAFSSPACDRTCDTRFSVLAHDYVKVTELPKESQSLGERSLENDKVCRIDCSQTQPFRILSQNVAKQLLDVRSTRSSASQFSNVSSANKHIPTCLCEQRDRQVQNTTNIHERRDRHEENSISLYERRDRHLHNTACLRERRDRQVQNTTGQLLIAGHSAEARTYRSFRSHNQQLRDINNNDTGQSHVNGYRIQPLFKLQDCFQGQGLLSLAACITYTLLLMFVFCACGLLLDSIKSVIGARNLQGIRANLIQSRRTRSTMASG